jgi:L-asparaginase
LERTTQPQKKIDYQQSYGNINYSDRRYPRTVKGYGFEIKEPAAKNILERVNAIFDFKIVSLMLKDSSDITVNDRKKILNYCRKTSYQRIIITHGTDTIIKTAQSLVSIKNKTIILTGAFKPEKFKNSDADFNFGFALGALNNAQNGVYVALCGKLFAVENIYRNKKGEFTERHKNEK